MAVAESPSSGMGGGGGYSTVCQSSGVVLHVLSILNHRVDEQVWIMISWLYQKPADLDLRCFQKKEKEI